ncbi:hypothetical protein JCM10908_005237 [Rhodotorula pacifica]|uniref:uncharacterized protein n=1 Tax=Rhodotorula pacifica TaxID=1495444 RepID=UPI003170FCEA
MHAAVSVLSLATLASVAVAQGTGYGAGYGRFPCYTTQNGVYVPNPNACLDTNLVNPGTASGNGISTSFQGTSPSPTGAVCTQEPQTGAYFCGIQGAVCTTDANCDNGRCQNGQCTGDFSTSCTANTDCLGYLYCLTIVDGPAAGTCGGLNAFCADFVISGLGVTGSALDTQNDYNCANGYCSYSGYCANKVTTAGGDCSFDPFRGCGSGLTPVVDGAICTCQPTTGPSGRARARRNDIQRRGVCPTSHTACSIEGVKGFECIDVNTNIEQCGGCASAGGVDCTAIEGVAAVGCVAGTCEIWSCEDGYTFDAESAICVASL